MVIKHFYINYSTNIHYQFKLEIGKNTFQLLT